MAEEVSPTCLLTGCQHLRHEADMRVAAETISQLKAQVEELEKQLAKP